MKNMKKLKFLPFLMALVFGLSFGFTACGDDDDDSSEKVETKTIESGQAFYQNVVKAVDNDVTAEEKAAAITAVVTEGANYSKYKNDAEYTTNFLAGVVMEKYGVTDVALAKSEEYQSKVASVKSVLDEGFTVGNVSNVLVSLSEFIASK